MPAWICEWPNGDLTLVCAEDVDAAVYILDELGAAKKSFLKPYKKAFFVDVEPRKANTLENGKWTSDIVLSIDVDEALTGAAFSHFDKKKSKSRSVKKGPVS